MNNKLKHCFCRAGYFCDELCVRAVSLIFGARACVAELHFVK